MPEKCQFQSCEQCKKVAHPVQRNQHIKKCLNTADSKDVDMEQNVSWKFERPNIREIYMY